MTTAGTVTLTVRAGRIEAKREEYPVNTPAPSYRCHRYPVAIIAQCVRLYYRFPFSYRGVEELMFERGVIVSYESIRRWCLKFGWIRWIRIG